MNWLEVIRRYVEEQLGDQVTWVVSHGGWRGIYLRTQNGWRHAVAVQPDDKPKAVAQAFQKAIDERRNRPGKC